MNPTDYILDSALVLIDLLQIRERTLTNRSLIRPLVIVGIAVASYLNGFPTAGNDLILVTSTVLLGTAIGTASGLTMFMRRGEDGTVLARAGWASAFFWVLGMGSRFAFIFWSTHMGASSIAHFSATNSITSGEAWTVALLGMALGEVLSRTGVMAWRRQTLTSVPAAYALA